MAEDKHPKLSAKAKSAYVFPKTQTYPIGDLKHGKIALVYSTWPDNKKDAQKVRTAVFKKYPSLRKWFKDGKYEVKGAESFEAKGCPHCELKNCGYDEVANYCPEAARIINEQEGMMNVRSRFEAKGNVRTMSGKPHTPRKLVKDKNITPKEAAKRMKLEANGEGFEAEQITYQDVNYLLMKENNPLFDMFNHEELWLDNQVKDGLIAIISNYPHPEITPSQAKKLKEYLEPHVYSMPIYLPDGPIENYMAEEFGAEGGQMCEGQKQNDRGYCDLSFDYGSSGITSECEKCGDELEWSWDDNEYDNEEIERKSPCVLGDDGFCRIGWDWGTGRANGTCEHCNSEYEFSFPDTPIGLDTNKFGADEGTFYDEGRTAAKAVFMPELKDRDSFGLMDSEYMIQFDLKPNELIAEMENGSSRYNQFSWGWGQEWDKQTMDYMLSPDESSNESSQDDDFYDHSADTFPDITDAKTSLVLLGAVLVGIIGASKITQMNKAETFQASQSCNEDSDCDDGFVCVDGECMKTCIDDGDCASWQECRDDLHPTENVCGEDKSDSDENPFADLFNKGDKDVENPNDAPTQKDESYSTTTKAVFGVGIVGAIVIGIKVLGGMQDKESEN